MYLETIIKGLENEVKAEREEKVRIIERKDIEIRNLNSIINDQRERAKKMELDF